MGEPCEIAVIVPAYNAEATIGRAMDSVLSQTRTVGEVIVIDDGSTDNTAAITEGYRSAIRYVHQDNTGVSSARNLGVVNSHCQWIAFLDADDEWLPHWVETQQRVLGNHPQCMWSFCSFEYARNGAHWTEQGRGASYAEGAICYFEAMTRGMRIQTSGFLIHRSVFDRVGMFNPHLSRGEDLDLWSRIAMRCPYIGYSPDVCYRYWLDSPSSLTRVNYSRDEVLNSICENMRLSHSLAEDVAKAYYPYARRRVISYILRAAAKKVNVSPKALHEAKTLFPPLHSERLLEVMLKALPTPIARRIVSRLVD
jgi:glycosyltransferase involved in cell wall biosynthesis